MKPDIGNISLLTWTAHQYLDWIWYIDHKDWEAAEGCYSDYLACKQKLMAEMLKDVPSASVHDAEDYVTGMVDGYIQAITE